MIRNISIIIPAFNASKTIIQCLEALNNQKYDENNYEIIVIDDGSSDDTVMKVKDFFKTRVFNGSIYCKENSGPGPSRNVGLLHARYDVIAFTDADCIPDEDWLMFINKHINKHVLIGGEVYSDQHVIAPWKMAPIKQRWITANLAIDRREIPNISFNKKLTGLVGNDTAFIKSIESLGKKYSYNYIDELKVQHPPNILNSKAVVKRALSRLNEFKLYELYGCSAFESMHIMYKPVLFKSISPLPFIMLLPLGLLIFLIVKGYYTSLALMTMMLIGSFLLYGFRFFVLNGDKRLVKMTDKLKTIWFLVIYNYAYLYMRISGSVKFKTILI